MNRKKLKVDDINTLLTSLMPNIESETRHQIHSLLSLVIPTLVITVSFTFSSSRKKPPMSLLIKPFQMSENMDLMRI